MHRGTHARTHARSHACNESGVGRGRSRRDWGSRQRQQVQAQEGKQRMAQTEWLKEGGVRGMQVLRSVFTDHTIYSLRLGSGMLPHSLLSLKWVWCDDLISQNSLLGGGITLWAPATKGRVILPQDQRAVCQSFPARTEMEQRSVWDCVPLPYFVSLPSWQHLCILVIVGVNG